MSAALLPPGVAVETGAADSIIAHLAFERESDRAAYEHLTGPGRDLLCSAYLLDHWLPEWGPDAFAFVLKLQQIARLHRDAGRREPIALTLGQLAQALGVSEPTVRRFIQALTRPDEAQGLKWDSLRTYLQFRQVHNPRGRGRRNQLLWTFTALLDDVLHPDHLPHFQAIAGNRPAPQKALFFDAPPSQNDVILRPLSDSEPPETAVEFQTNSHKPSQNVLQTETPLASKPIRPSLRAHEAPTPSPPAPMPTETPAPDLAGLAAKLLGLGLSQRTVDHLLSLPDLSHGTGAYWTAQWLEWLPAVRNRLTSPGGFIVKRINGAQRGNPEDQQPPSAYTTKQERKTAGLVAVPMAGRRPDPAPSHSPGNNPPAAEPAPAPAPDRSPEAQFDAWWAALPAERREQLQAAALLRLQETNKILADLAQKRPDSRLVWECLRPLIASLDRGSK